MRLFVALAWLAFAAEPAYRFFTIGNQSGVVGAHKPDPAFLLIGGGADLDEANRWFVSKAHGGDLLVLRATGDAAYNPYFFHLGSLNSARTLVIPNEAAARDPFVVNQINHAAAIFLSGGDQWNYVRLWNHSPTGDALRAALTRGIPLGGTSAGLAIMGGYIFTAAHDTVQSPDALRNPYDDRVQIAPGFLHIPALENTITDTHFSARSRLGRTLVFLARMRKDFAIPEARAIAIDERTAALLEPNGDSKSSASATSTSCAPAPFPQSASPTPRCLSRPSASTVPLPAPTSTPPLGPAPAASAINSPSQTASSNSPEVAIP